MNLPLLEVLEIVRRRFPGVSLEWHYGTQGRALPAQPVEQWIRKVRRDLADPVLEAGHERWLKQPAFWQWLGAHSLAEVYEDLGEGPPRLVFKEVPARKQDWRPRKQRGPGRSER